MSRSIQTETIVAQATPPGRGGIGIIRVSGPKVPAVAKALLGKLPKPRYATFGSLGGIDEGLALYFPAPHSFTGEDVLELQGHGGPVIIDMLIHAILNVEGIRLARPGEFSERAFLNDKLDLAQAEAIADLINAGSEQAARAALRSLQGEFSHTIQTLQTQLTQLRIYVEAAIDFPEEEIDFLGDNHITDALISLLEQLKIIKQSAKQGVLLREGMTVVIAGEPNVGKSSLLNRLSGRDSAIVTHIPGTTRDILREYIQLDGIPLHIIDTAGLRETTDLVEQEGIKRAWQEIQKADHILLLTIVGARHASPMIPNDFPANIPLTIIHNKIDLTGEPAHIDNENNKIYLSAKTGEGVEYLRAHLKDTVGAKNFSPEGGFIARRRHLDALERAYQAVVTGQQQLEQARAGELLAEDLRQAQQALGEITGELTSDDLLGEIFSNFCIGK
ncbi:MAG: tRNA uridine-5-carboxymethylaminomethyl(34) synthesis GTPase MnmE [Gammaproteobacteria bacterium]